MRGFFEIGIVNGKSPQNIGTLWRSAYQLGASGIFTVGQRYPRQRTDTTQSPRHIPLRHFGNIQDLVSHMPESAELIGIEMGGKDLGSFTHPDRAVYLLGAEDRGLDEETTKMCRRIVSLTSVRTQSFNVSVAGSIVMYHRLMSRIKA